MTRRRYDHPYDPDCQHCEYAEHLAEQQAADAELEQADPQRELEAADREAGMGRWS